MIAKTENKALAIALRSARERLAETQKQFASRIGVNQATISRWEVYGPGTVPSRAMAEQIIADIDRIHPINGRK